MLVGSSQFTGYLDPKTDLVVFYKADAEMVAQKIEWEGMNSALQAKFGSGFTASGSNMDNYAAQYKDGMGGWSDRIYSECSRNADCATTAKLKYRNNYLKKSDGSGVCMTDYYRLSITKNDVLDQYKTALIEAKSAAAGKTVDAIELSKPKF